MEVTVKTTPVRAITIDPRQCPISRRIGFFTLPPPTASMNVTQNL